MHHRFSFDHFQKMKDQYHNLNDVDVSSGLIDGQVLAYDSDLAIWKNTSTIDISDIIIASARPLKGIINLINKNKVGINISGLIALNGSIVYTADQLLLGDAVPRNIFEFFLKIFLH